MQKGSGSSRAKYALMLSITSFIWGSAFIAQDLGSDYMGAYTFNGVRFIIGALFLVPVILIRDRFFPEDDPTEREHILKDKKLLVGGVLTGMLLCAATNLQQIGIGMGSTAAKASFLTSMYIMIVPFLEMIFMKKKLGVFVWIAAILAMSGMYMMCMAGMDALAPADIYMILCAIGFAFQILVLGIYAPQVDPIRLSAVEFFVCGVISSVIMIFTEAAPIGFGAWLEPILSPVAIGAILYTGIFSSGIAYTIQVVAEKHIAPSIASLIFSTEAIFSAICGWLILGQRMSAFELIGSALILTGVLISQIKSR